MQWPGIFQENELQGIRLEIVFHCTTTVRSDAEEHAAEERPAWKHKNVQAWTKNVMWDIDRLPSASYVVKW